MVFPPLHNTMGCLFVGTTLSGAMWGITITQTYNYFLVLPAAFVPALQYTYMQVGVVCALNTVHQIMLSHLLYTYLVSNFGNPVILGTLIWHAHPSQNSDCRLIALCSLSNRSILGFIGLSVQSFLAYRVWVLSRKNVFVVGVVLLLVLGLFTVTVTYFAQAWHFTTFAGLGKVGGLSRAFNVLGAASNLGITTALSFYLWSSKSGMSRTDATVNRLILFCVRTGLLTTACAILSLITISVFPNTFVYITFYSALPRLYSISLLAMLNARPRLGTKSFPNISLENNQNRSGQPVVTSDNVRHVPIKDDEDTVSRLDHGCIPIIVISEEVEDDYTDLFVLPFRHPASRLPTTLHAGQLQSHEQLRSCD
ncbi:hypothetical protein PQX77_018871 [Marasmius sp. AFHP31]|nr:hypothetical protein PQX77_018871 [Marasmius sp. AFHP31]